MFYTFLQNTGAKHTKRSNDGKETTIERFTLYEKKRTLYFIYFNNYKKHVKDILEKYQN
jgi:hypothetical protein